MPLKKYCRICFKKVSACDCVEFWDEIYKEDRPPISKKADTE